MEKCSNSSVESISFNFGTEVCIGIGICYIFAFGTAEGLFVDGDLNWDILIPGFEDKPFSVDEEVLDILEDKFVVAVFFTDFWFLTLK